jgi:hypothetical protein
MMGLPLGMMIELLVAVLLLLTICYCVLLNSRLKRLKADEGALRRTVADLVAATEVAERAIHALKATAVEADGVLGRRLDQAEKASADLARIVDQAGRARARAAQIPAAEPARAAVAASPATPAPAPAPRFGFGAARPAFSGGR